MVFSGDQSPWASGQTDRGPGSQQRNLVRRGQRATLAVRRDVPSWLIGDSPSGAEASSGPPDTCRSTGCGVEDATGIPPAGTPGNRGVRIHTVFPTRERMVTLLLQRVRRSRRRIPRLQSREQQPRQPSHCGSRRYRFFPSGGDDSSTLLTNRGPSDAHRTGDPRERVEQEKALLGRFTDPL